jgi:hypothetical protein
MLNYQYVYNHASTVGVGMIHRDTCDHFEHGTDHLPKVPAPIVRVLVIHLWDKSEQDRGITFCEHCVRPIVVASGITDSNVGRVLA